MCVCVCLCVCVYIYIYIYIIDCSDIGMFSQLNTYDTVPICLLLVNF